MARFKFMPVAMGSGWISGHVATAEGYSFPSIEKTSDICLTLDAENIDEFSREVDLLIAELEEVRAIAKRKFAKNVA